MARSPSSSAGVFLGRRGADLVELADLVESCWAVPAERRQRGAADVPRGGEVHETRHAQLLDGAVGLHADLVADLDLLLSRRRGVDRHFVCLRPRALLEHEGVEAGEGRIDREADVRCAAELDHLAVAADQLRLACHTADGGVDAGEATHLLEQSLVERRRLDARVLRKVERRLPGDDRVGATVDRREDRVEGVLDRVREHERAGDRGHAEHDREAGQECPQLAAPERAKGDRRHAR
jgi:hypothetical protein